MWVPFERYLFNTVFVSVISTVAYLFIVTLAAYPLAKHDFVGKKAITSMITLALMFSGSVIALPQYVIMARFGMIDNYSGMILPLLSGTMGLYLCINYLGTLPGSIIESARIDGANEYMIWRRIVIPNMRPAIMTVLIFQFQASWNSSAGGVVFSEPLKLLPSAISQIVSAGIARAGVASAVGVVMMAPPILIFIFSQSRVMETMAHSGMKD
jgi:ABC-type glycerol-3-phosphate transport system permease component